MNTLKKYDENENVYFRIHDSKRRLNKGTVCAADIEFIVEDPFENQLPKGEEAVKLASEASGDYFIWRRNQLCYKGICVTNTAKELSEMYISSDGRYTEYQSKQKGNEEYKVYIIQGKHITTLPELDGELIEFEEVIEILEVEEFFELIGNSERAKYIRRCRSERIERQRIRSEYTPEKIAEEILKLEELAKNGSSAAKGSLSRIQRFGPDNFLHNLESNLRILEN